MTAGVQVIVQGAFQSNRWVGRTDVLRRVEVPSTLGPWSYEVTEHQLGGETKGGTILQLCLYADLVASVQSARPEFGYVVMPWSDYVPQRFRMDDYSAFYRYVRHTFELSVDGKLLGHGRGLTMLPGGQFVAIGAGRATHDAVLMVPGVCRGFLPGAVVGHRTFDRKQPRRFSPRAARSSEPGGCSRRRSLGRPGMGCLFRDCISRGYVRRVDLFKEHAGGPCSYDPVPLTSNLGGRRCADQNGGRSMVNSTRYVQHLGGISRRSMLLGVATTVVAAHYAGAQAQTPLASWNDGPAKQAIPDFVRAHHRRTGIVPPEDRIATFDQDGTLWVEHPPTPRPCSRSTVCMCWRHNTQNGRTRSRSRLCFPMIEPP